LGCAGPKRSQQQFIVFTFRVRRKGESIAEVSALRLAADKAYDSEKVRQQIKDEGALPIIPSRTNATKKAYCPAFTDDATKSKTTSAALKTGDASQRATTNLLEISFPPQPSSVHSIGSSCESRPSICPIRGTDAAPRWLFLRASVY
jgi:hypothetical protein